MIDKFLVILFLILILIIGIYNRSKSSTFKGFSKVSNYFSSNKLYLTATIFASSVGGGTIFGISEKVIHEHIGILYGLLLSLIIDILSAIYIIPRLVKFHNVNSIGEIFGYYYGKNSRVIIGIAAFMISLGYLSVQISVSGMIFSYIFEVNYEIAIILSYTIAVIYTSIGGLNSVIANNIIQFFLVIIAIPIITIFSLKDIGLSNFYQMTDFQSFIPHSENYILSDAIFSFLSFSVMGFHPSFLQRILISKNINTTRNSLIFKTIILFVFLIFISINAILSKFFICDDIAQNCVLNMISQIFPVGIKGLIIIGFLSAVLSTADSDLNIATISLTNDVTRILFKINDEQFLLFTAKIFGLLIGVFSILLALNFHNLVDLIIFSAGFWSPIVLIPLIFIAFDIKFHRKFFYLSSFMGIFSFILWFTYTPYTSLSPVFIGTLASFIIYILAIKMDKYSIFQK